MCSNFRERVSMPMLDGVLSIMEKRPTIKRRGEARPRPLMRPTLQLRQSRITMMSSEPAAVKEPTP